LVPLRAALESRVRADSGGVNTKEPLTLYTESWLTLVCDTR